MPRLLTPALMAVAAGVALAGCSDATTSQTPAPTATTTASIAPASPASPAEANATGGWITWDQYQKDPAAYIDTDVVLFFNASWCPTCQNTVKSLDSRAADFPAGLTVVSVDYDSATDLKKKYGVTTQHTFVQVDETGAELQKWTGSETVDAIQAKV